MEMEFQILMKSSHKMPVETTVNVQRDLKEWNLSVHQCLQPHRRKRRMKGWRKWTNQLLFLKKTQSLASSRQLKKKKKEIWRSQKLDNQRVEMELIDFVLNTPPSLWSLYYLHSCYEQVKKKLILASDKYMAMEENDSLLTLKVIATFSMILCEVL